MFVAEDFFFFLPPCKDQVMLQKFQAPQKTRKKVDSAGGTGLSEQLQGISGGLSGAEETWAPNLRVVRSGQSWGLPAG